MIEIKQWEDIKAEFSDTLIVGNGGSIAISSDFSYNKLYQWGKNNRYIKENAQGIFEHFSADKRDFERVLYKLNQADYVNKKVKITDSECKKVRKAYTDVRRSLIDTVIGLHPEQASVEKDIHLIKQYLLNFKIIFSLNYDLLVYWAAQERIDVTDLFLDGFSLKDNVKNSTSLLFDETSFATIAGKNVQLYFPHGNLLLYNTKSDDEKKITIGNKDTLLKAITDAWAKNDAQPLFICEGDRGEKLKQINNSKYLSHVFHEILPKLKKSITIYGWSLGSQDNHILAQLKKATPERIAVSVYTGQEIASQQKEVQRVLTVLEKEFGIVSSKITFFDAQSTGCWNNA